MELDELIKELDNKLIVTGKKIIDGISLKTSSTEAEKQIKENYKLY